MTNKTPSLFSIILTDYFCFLCTIYPIVIGAVAGYEAYSDPAQTETNPQALFYILLAAGGVTGACFLLLIWRIRLIRAVFRRGNSVRGKLESTRENKRRRLPLNSRVTFSYVYKNKTYKKSRYLLSSEDLPSGRHIQIMVNPDNPGQAFIRDIFL